MRATFTFTTALLFLLTLTDAYSQATTAYYEEPSSVTAEAYKSQDTPLLLPTFIGGTEALAEYMNTNLQYPAFEKKHDIEGVVLIRYYIAEDGTLEDITVARSVSPGLDKEAIRLVKNMPKWHPAIQNGQPRRIKYMLPIIFTLTF